MSEIVFPSTNLLLSGADAHKTPVHCLINVVASAAALPHKLNYIPSLGIVKILLEGFLRTGNLEVSLLIFLK